MTIATATQINQSDVFSFAQTVPASSYSAAVLADSPYQYYRCNDASSPLLDSSGNGFSVAAVNTPTFGAPGLLARSSDTAVTTGGTSYFATAAGAVPGYTGTLTAEAWCRATTLGNVSRICARNELTASGWGCGFSSANAWRFTTFGVKDYDFSGPVVVANTVYYVVFIYDSSTFGVDLWINGAMVGTVTHTVGQIGSGGAFFVGARDATDIWAGTLDEVAIYHARLSATRIVAHYNAGIAMLQTAEPFGFLAR